MIRRLSLGICCALIALVLPPLAAARTTTVTSFDHTKIHVNFFAAAGLRSGKRAPTVMLGPGWSSPGDTNPNDTTVPSVGSVGVGTLRHAGFNVLTWDPRGFGASGGTVEVDSPGYEGRDVSAMITWLARQPQALLDHPRRSAGRHGRRLLRRRHPARCRGDRPSDRRDRARHRLELAGHQLDKNGIGKLGWATVAVPRRQRRRPAEPAHRRGAIVADAAGQPLTLGEPVVLRHPRSRPARQPIRVPTLLIQGTADNLFTLQEAITNYELLRQNGVPGEDAVVLRRPRDLHDQPRGHV